MKYQSPALAGICTCLLAGILTGCSGPHPVAPPVTVTEQSRFQTANIPAGSAGEEIRKGKLIFDETPKYAHAYVGNQLSCADCHVNSGTMPHASPMIDMSNMFPMFNQRAGRVISMQERFQECFARSENGSPPPLNSEEIRALTAYVDWLSKDGVKNKAFSGRGFVKLPDLTGNPTQGIAIYAVNCAECHGGDGAGVPPVIPALWGPNSYNDGAGMNNPVKMAAFLVPNMPQNNPGSLTPQQAFDVAAFIHTMPRPKFNEAYKHY
ncbi:MAG TPA: c-type cytochrome [Acidobacteriaceae bacterium]|nr:c-type cytochrome [Terriglobia bacterium]HVC89915.1 c-type cytochrome [Acidobacteriaceae bacterium]